MIALEPLRREHVPLVAEWLGREHVRRWWRDGDQSLRHVEDALAGRDRTRYFVIVADGRPVGMLQTYLLRDEPEWAASVGEGQDGAGVDLLIGEPEAIGRGLGAQVLEQLAREIVFSDPQTTALVATVEEGNRRSWRAFEKAGFRHVRDVEEDGLPHRLMRLERGYAP